LLKNLKSRRLYILQDIEVKLFKLHSNHTLIMEKFLKVSKSILNFFVYLEHYLSPRKFEVDKITCYIYLSYLLVQLTNFVLNIIL